MNHIAWRAARLVISAKFLFLSLSCIHMFTSSQEKNPGCAWWGRGAIQTTGPENYFKLQRDIISKISSSINLCANPEAVCQ
jgi:predicted chitinase